jgi:hypothetical protein
MLGFATKSTKGKGLHCVAVVFVFFSSGIVFLIEPNLCTRKASGAGNGHVCHIKSPHAFKSVNFRFGEK